MARWLASALAFAQSSGALFRIRAQQLLDRWRLATLFFDSLITCGAGAAPVVASTHRTVTMASAAHLVATVRQLLEEGSIKGDSIGPNEMYACHYAPTLAGEQPCYCKTPLASGLGSQGGNRRWNATIAPGKTMASGLTERGMQASAYEQDSAFTLHGLDFAGVVYAGDSAIANARAKGVVFQDYHEYPEQ